jgi:hypothetical protein
MRHRTAVERVIWPHQGRAPEGPQLPQGRDGDRINAVLAAASHNSGVFLRWLERLLRALLAPTSFGLEFSSGSKSTLFRSISFRDTPSFRNVRVPGSIHLRIYQAIFDVAELLTPGGSLYLRWNLKDEIMSQLADISRWGAKFAMSIPEQSVI